MAYNPYDSPRGRLEGLVSTTRRQFLLIMGALGGLAALALGSIETLKFMVPGALSDEAPAEYKVAVDPKTIAVGTVFPDTAHRVSIVRDTGGLYAVFMVCTHLGCTPNYTSDVFSGSGVSPSNPILVPHYKKFSPGGSQGWACPCHGSRYYIDSTNFYGPAPRPMDWVNITFTADHSTLVVDRGTIVVLRGDGVTTPPLWRLNPDTGAITADPRFA